MQMTSVEEFLSSYTPQVQELVQKTRVLIQKTIPNALEFVDVPSKIIAYGYSPKYADLVCAIAPYKTYLNIIFSRGTQLPDPTQLLVGKGKRARHVKIENLQSIENPALQALINQAATLQRK